MIVVRLLCSFRVWTRCVRFQSNDRMAMRCLVLCYEVNGLVFLHSAMFLLMRRLRYLHFCLY